MIAFYVLCIMLCTPATHNTMHIITPAPLRNVGGKAAGRAQQTSLTLQAALKG
jgi:hypothetical protein